MARIGLCAAADVLGKPRKALQRWRKRPGAPFAEDGSVDPEELRAWAQAAGLLDRGRGRPTEVDRIVGAVQTAPAPQRAERPAPADRAKAPSLDDLTDDDRAALTALVAGDPAKLIDLAAKVDPDLLKRLAAMGKTRCELADAEKREMENRRKRGDLLDARNVEELWALEAQRVRDALEALPARLCSQLVGMEKGEIEAQIAAAIRGVLSGLAEAPA